MAVGMTPEARAGQQQQAGPISRVAPTAGPMPDPLRLDSGFQRERARFLKRIGDVRSRATSQKQRVLIGAGVPGVAERLGFSAPVIASIRDNPFSASRELGRAHRQDTKSYEEGLSPNLFYSSSRSRGLGRLEVGRQRALHNLRSSVQDTIRQITERALGEETSARDELARRAEEVTRRLAAGELGRL